MVISIPTAHMKNEFNLKTIAKILLKYHFSFHIKNVSLTRLIIIIIIRFIHNIAPSNNSPSCILYALPIKILTETDHAHTINGSANWEAISSKLSFM